MCVYAVRNYVCLYMHPGVSVYLCGCCDEQVFEQKSHCKDD